MATKAQIAALPTSAGDTIHTIRSIDKTVQVLGAVRTYAFAIAIDATGNGSSDVYVKMRDEASWDASAKDATSVIWCPAGQRMTCIITTGIDHNDSDGGATPGLCVCCSTVAGGNAAAQSDPTGRVDAVLITSALAL